MMPISRFSFYQRGYRKDSLDDKMYKIPELLLKNGAKISKEAVIDSFDRCLYEERRNVEALFLYSFMEKHGIIYSNGDKLLKNAKRLGLSDEKIKEMINSDDYKFTNGDELLKNAQRLGLSDKKIKKMINSDDYKFTSEAYCYCGNLENACALLEKGVQPDYYAILSGTKALPSGISPLGSSPEELSKMSKEDRVDLFEKSKELMFKHPRLREAALKNMIDVYHFSSEPEVRDSFKKTLIDLKRGKDYILEVNELKDVIKTSEGKDDKEIKSVGRVGLRTMYGRFVNKTR